MTDDEILEKLDEIIKGQVDLNLTIQALKKDFENNVKNVEDRFSRVEAAQDENKSGHKWIHERIDNIDGRVGAIEKNPVFAEWAAIKGRLFSLLWGGLIVIGGGIVLTALPKIIELLNK